MICLIVIDTCSLILNIMSNIRVEWVAKSIHIQEHTNALFYWYAKLPVFLIVERNPNRVRTRALQFYQGLQNAKHNKKATIPS